MRDAPLGLGEAVVRVVLAGGDVAQAVDRVATLSLMKRAQLCPSAGLTEATHGPRRLTPLHG